MKNIILTGLMGSGKSSVAKELNSFSPSFRLIETDELIIQKENMTIPEIFKNKGESYFRKIEKQIIDNCLKNHNQIISLGGGSLQNDFNFTLAQSNSIIFYLKADVDILYDRIKNDNNRPLLNCENSKQKLENLLNMREENYKKANYTIYVDKNSITEIAKEIWRLYTNETRNDKN